jgi:hypothetical protein
MTPRITCPSCSNEIPNDSDICPHCGAPLDDAATRRLESHKSPPFREPQKASRNNTPSFDSIDDARFVPGEILVDRYRIVGLLGRGGMGEVYRADDLKLGQPVALKFLPEHLTSDGAALARFHRDWASASRSPFTVFIHRSAAKNCSRENSSRNSTNRRQTAESRRQTAVGRKQSAGRTRAVAL